MARPRAIISDSTQRNQTARRPPADILREGFADDGLHPNAKGYELVVPVAAAAIQKALR